VNAEAIRWILWAALLVSVACHAAVPLLIPLAAPAAPPPPLQGLFTAVALACGVAALAARWLGLVRPAARGALDPASPEGAQRATAMLIVGWALAEIPSILGLVLALTTGEPRAGWPLAALSFLLLVALYPRVPAPSPSSAALARSGVKIG
jgi:hypothetical protein